MVSHRFECKTKQSCGLVGYLRRAERTGLEPRSDHELFISISRTVADRP